MDSGLEICCSTHPVLLKVLSRNWEKILSSFLLNEETLKVEEDSFLCFVFSGELWLIIYSMYIGGLGLWMKLTINNWLWHVHHRNGMILADIAMTQVNKNEINSTHNISKHNIQFQKPLFLSEISHNTRIITFNSQSLS